MQKFNSKLVFAAAILALAAAVPSANAAMISFSLGSFGSDPLNVVVTLSDGADSATAGYLQIDLDVTPTGGSPNTGDLTGLFVGFDDEDAADPILLLQTFPTTTAGGAWFDPAGDVTAVLVPAPGGCNAFNGDGNVPINSVDVRFDLGICGSSGGSLTSTSVFLQGLSIGNVTAVGARAQSVGSGPNGGGGSSKLFLGDIPPPPPGDDEVPEPATVTLMGAGLLGLMYFRRRRK